MAMVLMMTTVMYSAFEAPTAGQTAWEALHMRHCKSLFLLSMFT